MTATSIIRELQYRISGLEQGICITSPEAQRVVEGVSNIGKSLKMKVRRWTCITGFKTVGTDERADGIVDPQGALLSVLEGSNRDVLYLMDGFGAFLKAENPSSVFVIAALHEVMLQLKAGQATRRKVVLLTDADFSGMPSWLRLTQMSWPLPTKAEINTALVEIVAAYAAGPGRNKNGGTQPQTQEELDRIASAAAGLTMDEAQDVFALSLAKYSGRLDYTEINSAKKQAVSRSGLLEWLEPEGGLETIGGLEVLKAWLLQRQCAFSQEAYEYGLPPPKGILCVGQPGTGKTACGKAIGVAWGLPVLRLDMGALFGKYIGESEARVRDALKLAEAVSPIVMLWDEIDKGLNEGGRESDGGTSSRVLATLLTFLQEKKSPVFVFATANDVSKLRPEILRRGRWDALLWVGLPNRAERRAILKVHAVKRKRDPNLFATDELVMASEGMSGAEIEAAFIDAMFAAFSNNKREVTAIDLLQAMSKIVPLGVTAKEKLAELEQWARGRAISASLPDTLVETAGNVGRFTGMAS